MPGGYHPARNNYLIYWMARFALSVYGHDHDPLSYGAEVNRYIPSLAPGNEIVNPYLD